MDYWQEWLRTVHNIDEQNLSDDEAKNLLNTLYANTLNLVNTTENNFEIKMSKLTYIANLLRDKNINNDALTTMRAQMVEVGNDFLQLMNSEVLYEFKELLSEYNKLSVRENRVKNELILELINLMPLFIETVNTMNFSVKFTQFYLDLYLNDLKYKIRGQLNLINNPFLNEQLVIIDEQLFALQNMEPEPEIFYEPEPLDSEIMEPNPKMSKNTCFNFETDSNDNFISFLKSDEDNIVLNINNNLECWSRDKFLDRVEEDNNLFYYEDIKFNQKSYDMLEDENFCIYSFVSLGNNSYRIKPYTLEDYLEM